MAFDPSLLKPYKPEPPTNQGGFDPSLLKPVTQPTTPPAPAPQPTRPSAWQRMRDIAYKYPIPAVSPTVAGVSMLMGQEPPQRGIIARAQRGFASVPKSQADLALSFTENDDTLKQFLLKAKEEQDKQPRDLSIPEQAAELVGGLGGVLTEGLVAGRGGRIGIGAMFGTMEGGHAFVDAGVKALNEGQSPENALRIAKNSRNLMTAAGAASARLFPARAATRWMPALSKAFPQTLGQSALGHGAQVGGVLGGLRMVGNIGQQVQGLQTPLMEGVPQTAGFGFALGGAPFAVSRMGPALQRPVPGELPRIPRPIQPPPLPEGVQRAVPVRETAKVPVVETPRAGEKVGERVLTPEELAAKEKAVVKEAEALTPEQQAVERQRLQAELEGKPVEAPIEKPKVEVSEVQKIAEIRDRVKKENPGQSGPILERLIKKAISKEIGEQKAPVLEPRDVPANIPEKPAAALEHAKQITKSWDTFKAAKDAEKPTGLQEYANEIGAKFKTPEEIAQLKQWRDGAIKELDAKMAGKSIVENRYNANLKQAINEIVDGAVQTKSIVKDYLKRPVREKAAPPAEPVKEAVSTERKFFDDLNAAKERLRKENPSASEEYLNTMAMEEVRPAVKKASSADALKEAEQVAKDENLEFKTWEMPDETMWQWTYQGEGPAKGATYYTKQGATRAEIKSAKDAKIKQFEDAEAAKQIKEIELPKAPEAPTEPGGIGEPPTPPVQPPPLPPKGAPESLPSAIVKEPASDANFRMREAIPAAFRYFSEGMVERVARSGGEHSKAAEPLLNRVVSNQKGHYGDLTPVLDPALEAAGKMNKATKWLNDFDKVTDGAAIARAPEAIEGKIPVPDFAKPTLELAKKSNLRTGQMYEPVTEGYKATGAAQRNLTAFGFDLIRRGTGRVLDRYAEGTAKANNKPIEAVKAMLRKMKETYDEPSPNVASIERVNQDFQREFPRAVTHVKVNTYLGPKWEPVLHSQLYSYLEASARRASHVRSFREAFRTPEDLDTMTRNVRSELDPSHQKDFDALIRGLQGHPSDNYGGMTILSPDQPPAATLKLFNQTVGNLMAKFVLSGQMMTQAGETAVGATPIFLGAPRYLKAMAKQRQIYTELERAGSVNRVIYDMSTDPTRPILSKFRQAGNIISKGTAQQYLNELQEGLAAATARFVREDIMAGRLSKWDKAMLPLTFEKMGFTRAQAADMIQGKQPHLLAEFERKAAAWMTSGNKAIAEGSRLGASRLFNSIFRFQSYAMARSNQLRRVWGGVSQAAQEVAKNPTRQNATRLWNESRQFARFHTGATIQGALTSAVFALFYGGPSGLKILYNEAKDEPEKFLMESFMAATSGPLYLVMRGKEYGGLGGIGEQFVRSMFPYQIMRNFIDMAQGAGSYRDTLPKDRVGKFVQQKIPASRALSTGLSMVGLGWENKPLENSIKGFYRWRRDEMGSSTFKDDTEAYKKRAYFRTHMRKAVNALKTGDIEAVKASIAKAAQSPDLKPNSIVSSLNARKILKNPNLRDLTPEEIEKLRKRIGPEAVERLQQFDAMIDALIEIYQ